MSKTINQENQERSGLEEALGGWEWPFDTEVFHAMTELSFTMLAGITLSGVNISTSFYFY